MHPRTPQAGRLDLLSLELKAARQNDAALIHAMQVRAFTPLMNYWQDFQTSPAIETLEGIQAKLERPDSRYWLICSGEVTAGALRVVLRESGTVCRLSPVFVLPEWQGRGIAHTALLMAERLYPQSRVWELETLAQDKKLCSFYESLGYHSTGELRPLKPGLDLAGYRKET